MVRLREGDFAGPKLTCIDLQPRPQAPDGSNILNGSGFSDAAFAIVTSFF
jgi:hypothetical protein